MTFFTGRRRALLTASIVLSIGAVGITNGYASVQVKPISRFNHDAEGWTVSGDPVSTNPEYLKKGGNPRGFIRTTDSGTGGIMYWKAPAKFLGNQGAAYDGRLQFDLRETIEGRPFNAPDVILKGGGYRLTYDISKEPSHHWIRFKVSLNESGWFSHGAPATQAQMLGVLASLGSLAIRAEYSSHIDVDDLDNVMIKAPAAR